MFQDIQIQLESIFRTFFRDEKIMLLNSTTTDDIPRWDSLTHLELMNQIENHFNFEFTFDEIISFNNVGDLIECITHKTTNK